MTKSENFWRRLLDDEKKYLKIEAIMRSRCDEAMK
jgi:hypothetical protein